jgi:hypothetical protein
MTNVQVIQAFLRRQPADSSNLHSDGLRLYSYAQPIAEWADSKVFVANMGSSITTNKHKNMLKREIRRLNIDML